MSAITSRDNPRLRRWRDLVRDAAARRDERAAVIEGAHLVAAALDADIPLKALILGKSGAARPDLASLAARAGKTAVLLPDALFRQLSGTEAPAGIAAEIALPQATLALGSAPGCVFLDGIQDAGNVGAILRSAAAFGVRHAALGPGCADAWSPKVLRAGMGAHFAMRLGPVEDLAAAVEEFGGSVLCAVPRGGVPLSGAPMAGRIGWIFGAEGRGVSAELLARATAVTIPMPGGVESLNVAAAAAICFYAFSTCAARS
jgi:RNA methyltransferase, TrmH family